MLVQRPIYSSAMTKCNPGYGLYFGICHICPPGTFSNSDWDCSLAPPGRNLQFGTNHVPFTHYIFPGFFVAAQGSDKKMLLSCLQSVDFGAAICNIGNSAWNFLRYFKKYFQILLLYCSEQIMTTVKLESTWMQPACVLAFQQVCPKSKNSDAMTFNPFTFRIFRLLETRWRQRHLLCLSPRIIRDGGSFQM